MRKSLKRLLAIILSIMSLCALSTICTFAVKENITPVFPIADGVDIGINNPSELEPTAFWYSKYNYNSPSFGIGVYFNNGADFACSKWRSPYLEHASHKRLNSTNPSYYRVSYQMIYSSSGAVRKGVYFGGDITDLKVEFDVKETNNFKFYIAGDSYNTYCASGTLRY